MIDTEKGLKESKKRKHKRKKFQRKVINQSFSKDIGGLSSQSYQCEGEDQHCLSRRGPAIVVRHWLGLCQHAERIHPSLLATAGISPARLPRDTGRLVLTMAWGSSPLLLVLLVLLPLLREVQRQGYMVESLAQSLAAVTQTESVGAQADEDDVVRMMETP